MSTSKNASSSAEPTPKGLLGSARHDQQAQNYSSADSGGTMSHATTTDHGSAKDSKAGTLYSYRSSRDVGFFVRDFFGRTFNNLNECYLLPTDDVEWTRLDKQHLGLYIGFGALYACPDIVERILAPTDGEPKRVLDVGCGTGIWAMEMAARFPHVLVTALDLAPPPADLESCPPNIQFELGLEHLNGQFDVVHMRCVIAGIADLDKTLRDLVLCLKPGGILLSISGDTNLYNERKERLKMAKEEGDEDASAVGADGSWLQRILWEANKSFELGGVKLTRSTEILEGGLWDNDLCDPETVENGSLYLPLGPWPLGKTIQEGQLYQYIGVVMRQMFINLNRAYHATMLKYGISQETLDRWTERADDELKNIRFKMWVRYRFCWSRRRAGPNLPAPPLPPPLASMPLESTGPLTVIYPSIERYRTREENEADRNRRYQSFGSFPEPLVERIWRQMVQL